MFGLVAITVFGFVVKGLWNWLMPPLFGLHALTFWQALGLLVLSWILFGAFRGRPGHYGRRRFRERWEEMTPEQREKFRAGMYGHGRDFGAPPSIEVPRSRSPSPDVAKPGQKASAFEELAPRSPATLNLGIRKSTALRKQDEHFAGALLEGLGHLGQFPHVVIGDFAAAVLALGDD
jgi:hypothetical protein